LHKGKQKSFIFPIFSPEFLESINTTPSIKKWGDVKPKLSVFVNTFGYSEGWTKKGKFRGGVGLNNYGILSAWGVMHFGISEGKGG